LATITGLVAHVLIQWGVRLPVAGTAFYTDPREVFMMLGASLSGPVGAAILSIFLGSASSIPEFIPYRIVAYLVSGILVAAGYRLLIQRRLPVLWMVALWMALIPVYYGVTLLVAIGVPFVIDHAVYAEVFGGTRPLRESIVFMAGVIRYEVLFTTLATTIFWLSLPSRYRKPLWGPPIDGSPRPSPGRLAARMRALLKGRYLGIRLAGWIVLLSVIPFFGVVVTVQQDAQDAFDEISSVQRRIQAQTLAGIIEGSSSAELHVLLARFAVMSSSICAIADTGGRFIAHTDSSKIGSHVLDDHAPVHWEQLRTQGSGSIYDAARDRRIGFSWTVDGDRLVLAEFSPRLSMPTTQKLSASVQERLALGLIFISVSIALVMTYFVARPLRTLTSAVQSMSRERLAVTVPVEHMDDEVRILGESFNTMTADLRTAYRELEEEIAERIAATEEVRKSRAQLAEALRIARMGSFEVDLAASTIRLSAEANELIGPSQEVTPEKAIPLRLFLEAALHPDDAARMQDTVRSLLTSTSVVPPREEVYRIMRSDGTKAWMSVYYSIVWSEGHPSAIVGTMQDITARKRAEVESEAAKQRFQAVVENNLDAIVLVDPRWNVVYASPSIEVILGHPPGSWEGVSIIRDVHEDDLPMVRIAFENIGDHEGSSARKTFRMRHANGSWVWIECIAKNSLHDPAVKAIVVNFRDISERMKAEEELLRLRQAVETSNEIVFMTDPDGVFRYVNRAFTDLYGYAPEEVVDKHTPRILKSGTMPKSWYDRFWHAIRHESGVHDEIINRRKDGRPVLVEATANVVRDRRGTVLGYLAIQRDITERKRAETALRHSEENLRVAQRIGKIGSWEVDVLNKQTTWSHETYRILGHDASTFKPDSMTYLNMVHPGDRSRVESEVMATLQQGVSLRSQHRIVLPDGSIKHVETLGEVEHGRDGTPLRVVGSIQDITENKLFEEALNDKLRRLQLLRELGFLFASSLEQPEIIRKVSTFIPQYLGVTRAIIRFVDPVEPALVTFAGDPTGKDLPRQPIGFSISGRCVQENRPVLVNDCRKTDLIPQEWIEHFQLRSVLAVPIRTSAGVIGVLRIDDSERYGRFTDADVEFASLVADQLAVALENARLYTAARQAELQTERLNAELEQRVHDRTAQLEAVNKELESFSYSVSHDLRAPLRHISGFVELLRERIQDTVDDESLRYLATVSQSAVRLGNLIDELLAFSRIGRTDLRTGRVDLTRLVAEIRRDMDSDTKGRMIEWTVGEIPAVQGDATLLRLVMSNLLSNAVKFSRDRRPARITVGSLSRQPLDPVTVFVRDNGAGFDQSYAGKLFGVFQRLHTSEEFEGTGIGLANVRRIIQRHGGSTWAEGELDVGATFYFTLPTAEGV
jgi:PAS domain S-box-containing protein